MEKTFRQVPRPSKNESTLRFLVFFNVHSFTVLLYSSLRSPLSLSLMPLCGNQKLNSSLHWSRLAQTMKIKPSLSLSQSLLFLAFVSFHWLCFLLNGYNTLEGIWESKNTCKGKYFVLYMIVMLNYETCWRFEDMPAVLMFYIKECVTLNMKIRQ